MNYSAVRCLVPVIVLSFAMAACSKSSSGPAGGAAAKNPDDKPVYKVDDSVRGRNSIPTITDGAAPSEARKSMDSLMARADQEGKKLVLVVSAAWCAPCTQFTRDITVHPEYLKELHDNGYILAKAEFEKMVVGGGADFLTLNDYLPASTSFFPSFYVYSKGQWTGIGSINTYSGLKSALEKNSAPLSYQEAKNTIQNNLNDNSKGRIYASIFGNFAGLYSYSEAKDLIATLSKSSDKDYQEIAQFMRQFMWTYVGIGALNVASFAHDFASEAAAISDVSSDDFNIQPFYLLLETGWRTHGVDSTGAKCEAMWATYKKQLVPGKLSPSEYKSKMDNYDRTIKAACLHLQMFAAGKLTPELKAQVDTLDKSKLKDWGLLAADGEVAKAVAVYHARYQYYVDYYNSHLAEAQKALDDAKASGDQTKIDAAQDELDTENFRIKYHAQVDADTETEIQAGVPINPVHEIQ